MRYFYFEPQIYNDKLTKDLGPTIGVCQLTQTSPSALGPFLNLVPFKKFEEFSDKRKTEYISARLPLIGYDRSSLENKLQQAQTDLYFHSTTLRPGPCSLSHTKGNVGASFFCKKESKLSKKYSFGLDIEWLNREIKQDIIKFIQNSSDAKKLQNKKGQDIVKQWSIKEAAFKAAFSLLQKNEEVLTLTKIVIQDNENFHYISVDQNVRIAGRFWTRVLLWPESEGAKNKEGPLLISWAIAWKESLQTDLI